MAKKVFVFDLDDTLFCWKDYVFSGFDAVGLWLQEVQGIEGFAKSCKEHFLQGKRGNIFNLVFKDMGRLLQGPLLSQILDCYRNHHPSIELYRDAKKILATLQGETHLALITDGVSVTQKSKVAKLALEPLLDVIIYTDLLGPGGAKPNAKAYKLMMEDHFRATRPNDFFYVGDNILKDFFAPNALGWQTVHIKRLGAEYAQAQPPSASFEAKKAFHSLDGLLSFL